MITGLDHPLLSGDLCTVPKNKSKPIWALVVRAPLIVSLSSSISPRTDLHHAGSDFPMPAPWCSPIDDLDCVLDFEGCLTRRTRIIKEIPTIPAVSNWPQVKVIWSGHHFRNLVLDRVVGRRMSKHRLSRGTNWFKIGESIES